jgi:hypothetical protein
MVAAAIGAGLRLLSQPTPAAIHRNARRRSNGAVGLASQPRARGKERSRVSCGVTIAPHRYWWLASCQCSALQAPLR